MTYQTFTASQRATVKSLSDQLRSNADLWLGVKWGQDCKRDYLQACADNWDADGTFQDRSAYISDLRYIVKDTRRSQAAVFAAIRSLGFICRKTEGGDYRVADPAVADLEMRESWAAYCGDLAEALAQACYWAEDRRAQADIKDRRDRLTSWEGRARDLLAMKRAVYGDSFATAREAETIATDPLAWLELIADYAEAEIGIDSKGRWADEISIDRSAAAVAAENLEARAAALLPPPPAEIRLPEISPSPEAVAQLIEAAKAARFAIESAIYMQGLKALRPTALQLIEALEPFEADPAILAEAQMIAATLSGRSDLAA